MSITPKFVRPTQSESIHKIHKKKIDSFFFKINFEKSYVKVKCSFMYQALRMKGFALTWSEWITMFMQRGNVARR